MIACRVEGEPRTSKCEAFVRCNSPFAFSSARDDALLRVLATAAMRRGVLLRDFLERALYDRSSGYFSKEVIRSGQALAFKTFASEKDYRLAVARQVSPALASCSL